MNLNLYPYNMYILYASLVLLVIFLLITLSHIKKALQAVNAFMPGLNEIKARTEGMKLQSRRAAKVFNDFKRTVTPIIIALPVLLAIKKIYDASGLKGIKGYERAAVSYYTQSRVSNQIIKEVEKAVTSS